jgi:glucuronate isomerase
MNALHVITNNFLLHYEIAETLYHKYAKDFSIINIHNLLSPKEIAENKPIRNISHIWLIGNHCKRCGMHVNDIEFLRKMVSKHLL